LILALLLEWGKAQQLYNHNSPNSYRNQTWMSLVDDGLPIREINILGTHQSMAWSGSLTDIFRSQVQTLSNQLLSGMRAVDLRVKHDNDRFQMYDRFVNIGYNMDDVLTTIQNFLNSYPS
jgi:1-phosphatidylinositol phosphodiesterase